MSSGHAFYIKKVIKFCVRSPGLRCVFILCLIVLLEFGLLVRYFLKNNHVKTQTYSAFNRAIFNQKNRTNFDKYWYKLHEARVDWQTMLSPCLGNTEWGRSKPGWEKNKRTSARTSYIEYMDIRPAGEFSRISIRTRTKDGMNKTFGGDSWRVYMKGSSSVSATVLDHRNGSYEVIALLVEPGEYVVEAILDYSLCDGLRDPPDNWFKMGNYYGRYQPEGLLGRLDDYLVEPLCGGEKITIQIEPGSGLTDKDLSNSECRVTCSALWDGFGRWTGGEWVPYVTGSTSIVGGKRNVSSNPSLGTLWIYGDSLAIRFHGYLSAKALCKRIFSQCKYSYNWVYPIPEGDEEEAKRQNDEFDFRPSLVLQSVRDVLNRSEMKRNDSLLVLNMGLHHSITINFTTYQKLINDVIELLKSRERNLGSKAKVIWKTSTAIHKENLPKAGWNDTPRRFMNDQRVRLFDTFAMSAMCKAGIEILDVYQLSAAFPEGTTDAVHYKDEVFYDAEMEIERYVMTGFGNKLRKVCIK